MTAWLKVFAVLAVAEMAVLPFDHWFWHTATLHQRGHVIAACLAFAAFAAAVVAWALHKGRQQGGRKRRQQRENTYPY